MVVYVSLPDKLLCDNLTVFWNQLYPRLQQEYKGAKITSDYEGNGTIESADEVVFLYEFKEDPSCKRDIEKCKKLDIKYNFFMKFYAPDYNFYPFES